MNKKICTLLVGVLLLMVAASMTASADSLLVGDKDGFGTGNPALAVLPFSGVFTDNRDAGELAATNGAQITDVYDALGWGPWGLPTSNNVIFNLPSAISSATLVISMGDFQSDVFGPINDSYNGVAQAQWNYADGLNAIVVRSFVLDAATIAAINGSGQFILGISEGTSSDYVAFDYFQLNYQPSGVPEPASLVLIGSGLLSLMAFGRFRKR